LRSDRRKVDDLISDLRVVRGWRTKARLLYQHVCPPIEDVQRLSRTGTRFLPVLYLIRIARGIGRWFRPFGA
jgi:hypothetical protein